MNHVETIRSHPIFSGLSPQEAEEVAKYCEVMILPPGQIIIAQGELSEDMFVLFKGSLSIRVQDSSGKELEVGSLSRGEVFGEMGVFENTARSASIYSETEPNRVKPNRARPKPPPNFHADNGKTSGQHPQGHEGS